MPRISIAPDDIARAEEWKSRNRIGDMFPETGPLRYELYPKHIDFINAGATHMERLMCAGNRCGKSETAAYEVVCHATGLYPKWWKGRRFDHAPQIWVAGSTSETTRDIIQAKLVGTLSRNAGSAEKIGLGTGLIPAHLLVATAPKAGVSGAIGDLWVRHVTGKNSSIGFKSFGVEASGRPAESWFGVRKDLIWIDEECGEAVYNEAITRLMSTEPGMENGIMLMTFTPLNGYTSVVKRFLESADPGVYVQTVKWSDCPHLTPDVIEQMSRKFLPSQLKARSEGIPEIGEGAVYPVDIEEITVAPFSIPDYWPRCFGMDVGKTAVVWVAKDPESDTAYLYDEYFSEEYNPILHAAAIKSRGDWIPGVIDPSSRQSSQVDGTKLINVYTRLGLDLNWEKIGVETSIQEVWMRITTGRLKVFSTMQKFRNEFLRYHRRRHETLYGEKSEIVKKDDHCMDASRYALVSGLRYARSKAGKERDKKETYAKSLQRGGAGSFFSGGDGGWMG